MKRYSSFTLLTAAYIYAFAANADIDLRYSVEHRDGKGATRLFMVHKSCAEWVAIPQSYTSESGSETGSTGITSVRGKLSGPEQPSTNSWTSYVTSIDFDALADKSDEAGMKRAALDKAKNIPECKNLNLTERDIIISRESVFGAIRDVKTSRQGGNTYSDLTISDQSSNKSKENDKSESKGLAMLDFDHISVNYLIDTADARARSSLISLLESSTSRSARLGTFNYNVRGVLSLADSKMVLEGNYDSKWISEILNFGCKVKKDQGSLGGALIGAASLSLVNLGYENSGITCTSKLRSNFEGAQFRQLFGIDHGNTQFEGPDNKPIMIRPCNEEGVCGNEVTLESYTNAELLKLLLASKFQAVLDNANNLTFKLNQSELEQSGRQGTITISFNAQTSYKRIYYGIVSLPVQVHIKNMSPRLVTSDLTDSFLQCLDIQYQTQLPIFGLLIGKQPIPVDTTKCPMSPRRSLQ